MITSRLTRREFCYSAILAAIFAPTEKSNKLEIPPPEFQIGERVRTERACDDCRSPNYLGIDWEEGFVVGFTWQYDDRNYSQHREGWTYWVRFDETNNEIFDDRPFLDFVHHTEAIAVKI